MKKTIITCLALLLTLLCASPAFSAEPQRFSAVISPEMELLAGVLTQTTWMKRMGPDGEGNQYYQALRDFFTPYKTHEAVKIAQELTDIGFTFDAPIAFLSHLGPLPDLELRYDYADYVIRRARDINTLYRFRTALRDLARESNFLQFYNAWQPRYEEWVSAAALDGDRVVAWLENFFGSEAAEFHLILAPSMFPAGGYGAQIYTPQGDMISFQVIRESGKNTGMPEFPTGRDLEHLSLHEWGHSFVNPALEMYPDKVKELTPLYRPVAREMKAQAYNNVQIFMNELVLRAITTIAAEELYGPEAYQSYLTYEKSKSFYLVDEVILILRDYQNNREIYPTFNDFVPTLLEQMKEFQPPLLQRIAFPFLGTALLCLILLTWYRKGRRVLL
jgi:hypothetical protein